MQTRRREGKAAGFEGTFARIAIATENAGDGQVWKIEGQRELEVC